MSHHKHKMVHEKQGPVANKIATVKGTGRGKRGRKRGTK